MSSFKNKNKTIDPFIKDLVEEKISKMEEKVNTQAHQDLGAEEMYKRVTILKNLGIQIENLQTQKELMKGKFEFVTKENLSKQMKIQKFAGEPISFLLHKKNDFINKLLTNQKFKNYQDTLQYQNTIKNLSQDKPVKMNKLLERRMTRQLISQAKLRQLATQMNNSIDQSQGDNSSICSNNKFKLPLSVRSAFSKSTEEDFKIDDQYLEQIEKDDKLKDEKLLEEINKKRKIVKLLPKEDEYQLLQQVIKNYDEAVKIQNLAKKQEHKQKIKQKMKNFESQSRNKNVTQKHYSFANTHENLQNNSIESPEKSYEAQTQRSLKKFNTNLMYNRLKSGQALSQLDFFYRTALRPSQGSFEETKVDESSIKETNNFENFTYGKDFQTPGRPTSQNKFFSTAGGEFFSKRTTKLPQRAPSSLTNQRFRSDDKVKVDQIIKNCHNFCKENLKSLTQLDIDKEAMEGRRDRFTNISQLIKQCEGLQGKVLEGAFTYMKYDQEVGLESSRNVTREYKSGIMDPARIVAKFEKRTIKRKRGKIVV